MKLRSLNKRIRGGILIALWIVSVGYVAIANLPASPMAVSVRSRMGVRALAPEGWAFFTRDPREPHILLYSRSRSDTWLKVPQQNAEPRYWFGLRRTSRLANMALREALARVPTQAWKACVGNVNACAERLELEPISVPLETTADYLLGTERDYLVQVRDVVPWAWARSRSPESMASRIVWLHTVEVG